MSMLALIKLGLLAIYDVAVYFVSRPSSVREISINGISRQGSECEWLYNTEVARLRERGRREGVKYGQEDIEVIVRVVARPLELSAHLPQQQLHLLLLPAVHAH